jgi:hypothetical protein
MEKCKALLLENGQVFLSKANQARAKIAKLACPWIPTGAVCFILIYIIIMKKNRLRVLCLKEYPDTFALKSCFANS